MRRAVVALAAAAIVAGCARHEASRAVAAHTPRPQPSVSPAPPWSQPARRDLQQTLSGIFTSRLARDRTGIAVVSGDGTELFARHATRPVAPASTLKLLVAASALDALGPGYRFETRFAANAAMVDGTLAGPLWLVGGGDPTLTSHDLRGGVGALQRGGLREIAGALDVDASAFAGPEQNPHWDPTDLDEDYAAGTSAISLDSEVVNFVVRPGSVGDAARVRTDPRDLAIGWHGSIRTSPAGAGTLVSIDRSPVVAPLPGPTRVAPAADSPPRTIYDLDGHIEAGIEQHYYKPILGMPGYAGGAVAAMLADRGIGLAGGWASAPVPFGAVTLWSHRSRPLVDLVHVMLVESDNHFAETLLRTLGEGDGRAGTDAGGIAFERTELAKLGIRYRRLTLYDGSGLAPSDRVEPIMLARLLSAAARMSAGSAFVADLPRVGIEGTVKNHDLHAALGRTRAKSGHIAGVNGLAGYVATMHHGRIAFAFVVNDPDANEDVIYHEEDDALDALARM